MSYDKLRDLVSSKAQGLDEQMSKWVRFELNHLELHHLDDYLLNLYNRGVSGLSNKNNSSIAYLIGITNEKPTARINTVGGGFPDIDTDFSQSGREKIFEYLKNKYGNGFAHIGTMTWTAGKSVWAASARIHGIPFAKANKVSSMMPDLNCPRLESLLKEDKAIAKLYKEDQEIKEAWDDAVLLQDCVSNIGVHSCGIVLSDNPIYDTVPMWDSKGAPVTQYEGSDIERFGLVKLDILGLKCLDLIGTCVDMIEQRTGRKIEVYQLPMDDDAAYKVMWEGQNLGIFQFEGAGISNFVNRCKPKTIHDIAMITAGFRPGPLSIPGFMDQMAARIRGDEDDGDFLFPKYTHIFKSAHNLLIYQEQFMQLAMDMCGFTEIEADKLRKATGDLIPNCPPHR